MFRRERLTLSLETDEVRLLVARGSRLLRWDREPLPAGVVRNGQVVEPAAFGQVVAGLIERAKAPRRGAVVSLYGQRALVRTLHLPAVPARLLDEAVRREARRELPLPLDDLYLSWEVVGDRNASQLQVFALGVLREIVDGCVQGLHSAGVLPALMDLKPLALVRAVNRADVLIADLEAETGDVVLVRGFVPHIVRAISLPGQGGRPLEERAELLIAEIQRTLEFYATTLAAQHPAWSPVVCLTGALAGRREVRTPLMSQWPLVEPEPPLALPDALPWLDYLVNVGLALKRSS